MSYSTAWNENATLPMPMPNMLFIPKTAYIMHDIFPMIIILLWLENVIVSSVLVEYPQQLNFYLQGSGWFQTWIYICMEPI